MTKAIFLDRDGTICKEVHYLKDLKQLEILPRVAEAIKLLNTNGYKVVIITNQSAIARGYLREDVLKQIHQRLMSELRRKGAHIDAIYYCPHHPDEGCNCRKPKTSMLENAASDLNITIKESYMIGDKCIDVETGLNAGCKSILVLTGYGSVEKKNAMKRCIKPAYIARDLYDAVRWILSL